MDARVNFTPPGAVRGTPAVIASQQETSAAMKAVLFILLNLRDGAVTMRLPNGAALTFGDGAGPIVEMTVRNQAFAKRVIADGDIGFADSFVAGEWDTPHLADLLCFFADNAERLGRIFKGNPIARAAHWLRHLTRANTRSGSRRNIHEHYDLGNAFYSAWLDPTMTYSAARYAASGEDLTEAQHAKYHALARQLDLKPGDRVLEIGCGWGGFAEIAAGEYGAHVTGLTLSTEQLAYAKARIAKAGLADRVDLKLLDYRDVEGQFDKVASIEMFEAVGEKYWPAYFSKIASVLKPGGKAALQIITIRDDLFTSYRQRVDFIQRYVFPGGMLPSVARLREETSAAGLRWETSDAFGGDYAKTLAEWARRFSGSWGDIRPLGFDEPFRRLWLFYLAYCEAGFRTGRTDVIQVALAKP